MGSLKVTLLLLLASAVVLVCQAQVAGYPFDEAFKRALDEEDEESSPAEKNPFKRLVLLDPCSNLMQKCHLLQHCCGDLKCKYSSYLPPRGRCQVDVD